MVNKQLLPIISETVVGNYCETSAIYYWLYGPLSFEDRSELPPVSGVYIVFHGDKALYVGRSSNIKDRWYRHHRESQIPERANLYWIKTAENDIRFLEAALIEKFKPTLNGSPSPTVRLSTSMPRELFEAAREKAESAGVTLSQHIRDLLKISISI